MEGRGPRQHLRGHGLSPGGGKRDRYEHTCLWAARGEGRRDAYSVGRREREGNALSARTRAILVIDISVTPPTWGVMITFGCRATFGGGGGVECRGKKK